MIAVGGLGENGEVNILYKESKRTIGHVHWASDDRRSMRRCLGRPGLRSRHNRSLQMENDHINSTIRSEFHKFT
jgi:hypothetical protein